MAVRSSRETISKQADFCFMLMDRIKGNVNWREKQRNILNTYPYYMEQSLTRTAIKREITELRAALSELSKMVGQDGQL